MAAQHRVEQRTAALLNDPPPAILPAIGQLSGDGRQTNLHRAAC